MGRSNGGTAVYTLGGCNVHLQAVAPLAEHAPKPMPIGAFGFA